MAAFRTISKELAVETPVTQVAVATTPTQEEYLTSTVDNAHTSLKSLITNIEGSSWHVTYYSQVLGANNETRAQDVYGAAIYQQYRKIKRFELKVSDGLASNYDISRGEHSLEGESAMYPSFIPNVGDMIVAELPNGRVGILNVHEITPMSIYNERVYTISYKFSAYFDTESGVDLESKVVESVTFNYDYLVNGKDPFMTDKSLDDHRTLANVTTSLVDSYYSEFWSRKQQTWLTPLYRNKTAGNGDDIRIYDPAVVEVMNAVLTDDMLAGKARGRVYELSKGQTDGFKTIYDALLHVDPFMLNRVEWYKRLVPVTAFAANSFLSPIYYSGITAVIWPSDVKTVSECIPGAAKFVINDDPYNDAPYYVFGEGFYRKEPTNQTVLERLVGDYLGNRAVDLQALLNEANNSYGWTPEMRFYLYPVLIMLIKVNLGRGIY